MRNENRAEEQAEPATYVIISEKPSLFNSYLERRVKEGTIPRGTPETN